MQQYCPVSSWWRLLKQRITPQSKESLLAHLDNVVRIVVQTANELRKMFSLLCKIQEAVCQVLIELGLPSKLFFPVPVHQKGQTQGKGRP